MRRRLPAVVLAVLVLSGCVPAAFDPDTGEGYSELLAGFAGLSPEARLATIAEHDLASARMLWSASGVDDALGGADAADAVFTDAFTRLRADADAFDPAAPGIVLAATTQGNVAEAHGAGIFTGMLVSDLLTKAGLAATKDGATGNASQDFGKGGTITIDARADGTTTTTLDLTTEYQGVTITVSVSSEVDPCPDPDGWVEPRGVYEVVIEGPDGTGNVTQVEVAMNILVNDEAEIAMSDYSHHTVYVAKPKPTSGGAFDMSGGAVDFSRDESGAFTIAERAGWADDAFLTDAVRTGEFLSQWVASSLEKAVEGGWKDGRCIDLRATPSAGPTGLDPGAEVSLVAAPIATRDGRPAGGTVTAELASGGASVSPSGTKVPAEATFGYVAPPRQDESGTVRLESRSKRGIGMREITFDTSAQHYAISGGSGVYAGSGEWCAGAEAFSVTGGTVSTVLTLDGPEGGSIQYVGADGSGGWNGGGTFTVSYRENVPVSLSVGYAGMRYTPAGVFPDTASVTFALTPKSSCDAAG